MLNRIGQLIFFIDFMAHLLEFFIIFINYQFNSMNLSIFIPTKYFKDCLK
jgi:hypothetical protein